MSGFIVSPPNTVVSGIMPTTIRAHSGNELELSQVGKWRPHLWRRWLLPHLLWRPGRAVKPSATLDEAYCGIASFNDTLGHAARRGLRSANRVVPR